MGVPSLKPCPAQGGTSIHCLWRTVLLPNPICPYLSDVLPSVSVQAEVQVVPTAAVAESTPRDIGKACGAGCVPAEAPPQGSPHVTRGPRPGQAPQPPGSSPGWAPNFQFGENSQIFWEIFQLSQEHPSTRPRSWRSVFLILSGCRHLAGGFLSCSSLCRDEGSLSPPPLSPTLACSPPLTERP